MRWIQNERKWVHTCPLRIPRRGRDTRGGKVLSDRDPPEGEERTNHFRFCPQESRFASKRARGDVSAKRSNEGTRKSRNPTLFLRWEIYISDDAASSPRRFRVLFGSPFQSETSARRRELESLETQTGEAHRSFFDGERRERAQENENAVESNRETTVREQGNE